MDLKDGFFHIDVAEESQKYLAFITPWGQFIPMKALFGFCNSPPVFQHYIRQLFQPLIEKGVIVTYMDDIFIKASNESEAFQRLQTVLELASVHGLKFNWKKCYLLQRRIEFLGYAIQEGVVTPTANKIEALHTYPKPVTQKQLQRFLGLTSYSRKFIFHYAEIAKPLSDMLRSSAKFIWEAPQEKAFQDLRSILMNAPVLQLYRPDRETELHCDASKDKAFHPVYYMSRKTTETQRKYHSYELETLAVVRALENFRIYLHRLHFKIVTDCKALQQTLNCNDLKPKLAGWAMLFKMFNYSLEHRAGSRMQHVDVLSRRDCVLQIHDPIIERLMRAQKFDEKLQAIRSILRNRAFKNYTLDNGLVYEDRGGKWLLVVPKGMGEEIIKRAHEFGHFSVKKTMEKLLQGFPMENMQKQVEKVISNCVPCILGVRKEGKQEGFLRPIPKEDAPMHTWHVDHIGPLPAICKDYRHLLVIVDGFAKYTRLFATKTKNSEESIKNFKILQQHFGNPDRLVCYIYVSIPSILDG
ncbi:hypothetical protein TKK_0010886 [Trichogramma kaykai]